MRAYIEDQETASAKPKSAWYYPLFVAVVIFLVHVITTFIWPGLKAYGIQPRTVDGLYGIVAAPLLHGDWTHLGNNLSAFVVLMFLLFRFYKDVAWKVFSISWLFTGLLVWIAARDANHIGASGIVYALTAYLFVSGVLIREVKLIGVTLLVAFLYGSIIWGIFPLQEGVSWESHLWGAVTGVMLAFYYRKKKPQKKIYDWEREDYVDENPLPYNGYPEEEPEQPKVTIRYTYREKEE